MNAVFWFTDSLSPESPSQDIATIQRNEKEATKPVYQTGGTTQNREEDLLSKEKSISISGDMSFRLSVLKFISIIAVVYIHSYTETIHLKTGDLDLSSFHVTHIIETFIYQHLARFAVPLFYCISGYIFFKKNYTISYYDYFKKKTRSLLFPFLLWNTICIVFTFFLQCVPFSKRFFTTGLISDWNLNDWFNAYIGAYNGGEPFLYPLWFIQILFMVTLIAPLLKDFFIKYPISICVLLIFNVFFLKFECFNFFFFRQLINGLSFFLLGHLLALYQDRIDTFSFCISSGCLFFAMIVLRMVFPVLLNTIPSKLEWLLGVLFVFSLSYYFSNLSLKTKNRLLFLSSFTFVIYLMHENSLTILKKIFYTVLCPFNLPFIPLTIFIVLPFLLSAFLVLFGFLLKKYAPGVYHFLFSP